MFAPMYLNVTLRTGVTVFQISPGARLEWTPQNRVRVIDTKNGIETVVFDAAPHEITRASLMSGELSLTSAQGAKVRMMTHGAVPSAFAGESLEQYNARMATHGLPSMEAFVVQLQAAGVELQKPAAKMALLGVGIGFAIIAVIGLAVALMEVYG